MAQRKLSRRSRAARRYQNLLRFIKKRGDVNHREAQQLYRDARQRLKVKKVTSRKFHEYSDSFFRVLVRRVERKIETVLLEGEIGEEIAFAIRDLPQGRKIDDILAKKFPKTIQKMKTTVETIISGVTEESRTVTRGPISVLEFWPTYFDSVRELLNKAYRKFGKQAMIALIVTKITAI